MKVVIAGGGAVGAFIAGELQEAGHEVHIIEQDEDRVSRMLAVGEPVGATWHVEQVACPMNRFLPRFADAASNEPSGARGAARASW